MKLRLFIILYSNSWNMFFRVIREEKDLRAKNITRRSLIRTPVCVFWTRVVAGKYNLSDEYNAEIVNVFGRYIIGMPVVQ